MPDWRPIPGFPGHEVSAEGQVRSIGRVVTRSDGKTQTVKPKLMALTENVRNGYVQVSLRHEDGTRRTALVHRLVLLAFEGPPPEVGMQGSHLNACRQDNRISNLRWHSRDWNQLEMRERNHRPLTYDAEAFIDEWSEASEALEHDGEAPF